MSDSRKGTQERLSLGQGIMSPTCLHPPRLSLHELSIEIGDIPILVRTDSTEFAGLLMDRYGEFITTDRSRAVMELEVKLLSEPELRSQDAAPGEDSEEEVSVRLWSGRWVMERGDFRAEWDPQCRQGWVRQSANPYSIDSVLRILHSLLLARAGGFLLHAASALRNGRAFVFAGCSGAGKTTLARLAPPDVTLLTDEISYVKQVSGTSSQEQNSLTSDSSNLSPTLDASAHQQNSLTPDTWHLTPAFEAFGTPFAGELARLGQKARAPLAGLFLLKQGPENRIEFLSKSEAAGELLRHVLFFAREEELVRMIFQTVLDFVGRVPVRRLVFAPSASVWELIA